MDMNTSHYPSLELCKKLKEISFPHTEFSYYPEIWKVMMFNKNAITHPCPSVMDMLDLIPDKLPKTDEYPMNIYTLEIWKKFVAYSCEWLARKIFDWTVPNSLAEMILWLHENKYISFDK